MKSLDSHHRAHILTLMFLFALLDFIIDGCKKDSSLTGPVESPGIPSVNGHWVGGGNQVVNGTNYSSTMVADFVQAYVQGWDSKFAGTMSTTWPAISQTNHMYCKGTVTTAGKVTLVDTGGVAMFGGKTVPVETSVYSNRTTVVLSASGDTMSYGGPFGLGTEVFVLVKQK